MPKRKRVSASLLLVEAIERRILILRGHRVMLDRDLAELYGVETRALNQAVKRNHARFPDDFMFQLTMDEAETLAPSRSQTVILNRGANVKYRPYAFTEHGTVMLANERLERRVDRHDTDLQGVLAVLRKLVEPLPLPPKRRIGFLLSARSSRTV
jgi:hypothetical protein